MKLRHFKCLIIGNNGGLDQDHEKRSILGSSAWITAAVQRVVEGAGVEAQAALIEAFSSSVLLDLLSHISSYPIRYPDLG